MIQEATVATSKLAKKKPAKKKPKKKVPHTRAAGPKRASGPRLRVRPQPIIAVVDVVKSSRWYAELLGLAPTSASMHSDHAHIYDRLMDGRSLVLQLHAWDEEDHPNLVDRASARPGHGVLLWFEVDDFDAAVARAEKLRATVIIAPHVNPAP